MKILETYKNLLNEAEIEACVNKFGYELFGDELGGKERNTKIEDKYVDYITDFTGSKFGDATEDAFIKAMKTLKNCSRQYPDILIPEKTKVYRGLTLSINNFINNGIVIDINKTFPYTYTSKYPIESWSTNFDVASIFGNQDMLNDYARGLDLSVYQTPEKRRELLEDVIAADLKISFVLIYESNPREFLFKSKYFRVISKAYHEDELLRMSTEPIKTLVKFNDHIDVFLTYKAIQLIKIINKAISER